MPAKSESIPRDSVNRYRKIISWIFDRYYRTGAVIVPFTREDIVVAARELKMVLPKNIGDLIYSFRYRVDLPPEVVSAAPAGTYWIIRPAGRAKYEFHATAQPTAIVPNPLIATTKIPDSTPGVIDLYAMGDEQALLAKLRYNRLLDIFTCVACYSLQNHLRTTVKEIGQVETDELYVGLDRRGCHYIIPVQAKGGNDRLSIVQIEQDVALCGEKFPNLICLPVAAQFLGGDVIAMFLFEAGTDGTKIVQERHYHLVPPDQISQDDLKIYEARPPQT